MSEEEQEQANETGKTFCSSPPAMFEQETPNESSITIPSCSPPGILEWIVKGDDFVHWLTKSKEVVDREDTPLLERKQQKEKLVQISKNSGISVK